jgi:integrase
MAHRLKQIREVMVYGERPRVRFEVAAERYVSEYSHLRSMPTIILELKRVMPYIGHLYVDEVYDETLASFKRDATEAGLAASTVNKTLAHVRRVLNLCARKWRTNNRTWLAQCPLIEMAKGPEKRPYPLEWSEQQALFAELPEHLRDMASFDVNTGLRESAVVNLRWDWEVLVPELQDTVFVCPGWLNGKNDDAEYLLVLNRESRRVLEDQRGKHPEFVFTYKGEPVQRMYNSAWKRAWRESGLPTGDEYRRGVHNLRHTFGHRLRAAGVSFEDRQDLLWHKSGRVTTHYSAPDLQRLVTAANSILNGNRSTILRVVSKVGQNSGKTPEQNVAVTGGAAN